jgi:pimeloyl-ACP methyl ester carboxylesterase
MIFEHGGVTLHYETHGTGEPLLFVHGFLGCGANWRHIFPEPPAGFTLIAPDLRGHGASNNPSNEFSLRQCARDVEALLRHLGVDRAKAIGISGGGITLLHMATSGPGILQSMVLVSAPPYYPAQARAIQRVFSEEMLGEGERRVMRESHAGGEAQIQQLFAHARAFADDFEDVSFTPPQLATIAADTLIVFGDRDPLYPVSMALDVRAAIPNSYLWVVPNGGHSPVFGERAALFSKIALAFLRDKASI